MHVLKLLAADDANHLPVIRWRSSSRLGGRALRESIQLLHKRIVQLNQSRRGIFFKEREPPRSVATLARSARSFSCVRKNASGAFFASSISFIRVRPGLLVIGATRADAGGN